MKSGEKNGKSEKKLQKVRENKLTSLLNHRGHREGTKGITEILNFEG